LRSIGKIKNISKKTTLRNVTINCIDEANEGQRVDNYLIRQLKKVPKSYIYRLVRSGQVRVNSKRINVSYKLQLNDTIRIPPIRIEDKSFSDLKCISKSRLIPLEILFQDDALLIINKPAGMAVHGGSGISLGVIEQLRAQYPDWKFLELVHRLDRETSGVLLLAKKRKALIELHRQIREGLVEKRYYALIKGKWTNIRQNVKLLLNKYMTADGERRVAVVNTKQADKAIDSHTIFTLKKTWGDFSLVEAELKTGRTHQIRVHLAHLGFPIAGDDKYGDFALNKRLAKKQQETVLSRMFLHAFKTVIKHPITGELLSIEAPLTKDLQVFINKLDDRLT